MINHKALAYFITITFGLTITMMWIARFLGFDLFDQPVLWSQLVVLTAMFIPAISAIFVQLIIVRRPLRDLGFKIGPWWMYLKVYLGIVAMYLLNYTVTWIFFVKPDFSLKLFMSQFGINSGLPLSATTIILLLSLVTFIIAPLLNIIPSLGEEIGWRGFLLPALEPLGKVKALIISGMIWALWHTPMIVLIGFGYGQEYLPGIFLHFITVTGFGIWVGYVWLKTRSTILAAFMHATFNANAYGVWTMIFVSSSKVVIGAVGIIGASLALIVGGITLYTLAKKPTDIIKS